MPEKLGLSRTLMCLIVTPTKTLKVRALIDPGSQITVIQKSIATKLGLRGPTRTLKMGTSGAQKITFSNMMVVNFQLASLNEEFITDYNVEAITMPKVTCDIGKITIDPKKFNHLKGIKFTEELPMTNNTSTTVELLIGEPITTHLFKKMILGDMGQPAATIYDIGACLSGTANPKNTENQQTNIYATVEICEEEDPIEEIKKWFTLENVGIEDPSTINQLTAEEQKAEELMEKNTYYDPKNKCYFTRLLWIDEPIQYTNVRRATATATRMVKRFSKEGEEEAWTSINSVYQTNLDLGIAEPVPNQDLKKTEDFHYICMSMVFKPESSTTPVRPVYNANQEFGEEKISFNKKLIEGPNYLPQLSLTLPI